MKNRVKIAGIVLTLFLLALFGSLTANAVTINEYQIVNRYPRGITTGPDGNIWFTEESGNKIGRITPGGSVTEFPIPTPDSGPYGITAGPDGNLWFSEAYTGKIGRIATASPNTITEFQLPAPDSEPMGITAGPDGNIWFTELNKFTGNKIGRITPGGVITEFPIPTPDSGSYDITAGPDGNLWFAEAYTNKIGRIATASPNTIKEFTIPTAGRAPYFITAGPDGNLWFTESNTNRIGQITTGGSVTEFPIPSAGTGLTGITAGPDGNLWFSQSNTNRIGQITTGGSVTEFPIPTSGSSPWDITAGPDGNLWFAEYTGDNIGRITTAGGITEFPIPSYPYGITAGPDGNLWFTENYGNNIGQITTAGTITEFPIPTASSWPFGITAGPDGNLWFTEELGNKIGRITTAGVITDEFTIPTASSSPFGITAGPDGNLWFTEGGGNKIGRITTAGTFTEFAIPTASSDPADITAGPDGNLWFTEVDGHKIGRITTAGVITEFAIPTAHSSPIGITAGPDGNLWFTESGGNNIGRITTAGVITEFPIPSAFGEPVYITAGPDGNLWFTELAGNKIGRITTAGVITEFTIPTAFSGPYGITGGPDGNLWFTEVTSNKIGRVTSLTAAVPSPPTLSSPTNGETTVDINPTFSWNASAGADSYHLQVSPDPEFPTNNTVVDQSGIAGTSYVVSAPLLIETFYYWRVNATNANGTSGWSETWQFRTQPAYGNVFKGVRGTLDPDTDNDGLDDCLLENRPCDQCATGTCLQLLKTDYTKKTLFVRPKDEATGGYWAGFIDLFPDPRPGFAKIPAFYNAGIEIVVIGNENSNFPYEPMRHFTYDPAADPNQPNCDILEIVYKDPRYPYSDSPKQGHTYLTSGTNITWSWDTKGYTPNSKTTQLYKSYGYFTPQIFPLPLKNYFTEGAYLANKGGINLSTKPETINCYTSPYCGPSDNNVSPMNLNQADSGPPYLMHPDYTLDAQGNLTGGTVEFNAITFDSTTGMITAIGSKGKTYTPQTVIKRTIIHEIVHALLGASNSDHCADPNCIMYSGVKDWDVQDFGTACTHKSGGSYDIRNRIHNTRQVPAVPTLLSPINGIRVTDSPPIFNWSTSIGATEYALQVCTDSVTPNVPCNTWPDPAKYPGKYKLNATGIIGPPIQPQVTLTSGTTYYWHVNAKNQIGTSAWSSTGSFKAK